LSLYCLVTPKTGFTSLSTSSIPSNYTLMFFLGGTCVSNCRPVGNSSQNTMTSLGSNSETSYSMLQLQLFTPILFKSAHSHFLSCILREERKFETFASTQAKQSLDKLCKSQFDLWKQPNDGDFINHVPETRSGQFKTHFAELYRYMLHVAVSCTF